MTYKKLLEVVMHAVAKLSVLRSEIEDRYLTPGHTPPPRKQLPLFPDLHTEVLRFWNNTYSTHKFTPSTSNYKMGVSDEHFTKIQNDLACYKLIYIE